MSPESGAGAGADAGAGALAPALVEPVVMDPDAAHAAWVLTLDGLEAALATDPLTAEPTPWNPPAGLGPLPASLAERAMRILDAQHAAIMAIRRARRSARAHMGAVREVAAAAEPSGSVYLDVSA